MSIEKLGKDGFVIEGEQDTHLAALIIQRRVLISEIKGFRIVRGPLMSKRLKQAHGWTGNPQQILEKLEFHIKKHFPGWTP